MVDVSVVHWDKHHFDADSAEDLFDAVRTRYDELVSRGGKVTAISLSFGLSGLSALVEYRVESAEELSNPSPG